MSKTLAIAIALVLLAIASWGLLFWSDSFSIVVNGEPVVGPLRGAIGASGFVAALIACFCAAVILLFVFAGIGIVMLGCVVFAGMIVAWISFPFVLPLLIPLAIL